MEAPPHDLLPLALGDANIKYFDWNSAGNQYTFRPNWLHKPFDNPKVREALFYAFNQEDFVKATVGDPKYYKLCKSYFPCGTPFANEKPLEGVLSSNFKKARELLAEAGYDGTPIVLMHSTDLQVLTNLAPVAKQLMEKAGFKVEMQSMDWQSVVSRRAKKDAPTAGGWHAFLTSWVAADITNPIFTGFMNSACDKAMFGWPCDAEIEKLRDEFARETDPGKQKAIADALQMREVKVVTHIPVGQWYLPAVMQKKVNGMLPAPAPVFWNISID
jgi:peptide/nickel transport system substrate-binding protein